MATPNLPAVRLPAVNGGECIISDGVGLELPPNNKFSVSWPTDGRRTTTPPMPERSNFNFEDGDSGGSSDGDSGNEHNEELKDLVMNSMPTIPLRQRFAQPQPPPKLPQLSRALSMPLPSQLGYLRHPHKSNPESPPTETIERTTTPPDPSRLKELSVELADSVQLMIQTMLQVSPPQLLDPAKEQFSACSLSVPTSSMSAMLTSMKNLNYISANMADLCANLPQLLDDIKEDMGGVTRVGTPGVVTDFDIGEMLQSVGDSLSGAAAQAGVDLVLYHEDDIGLRHVCVKGDESGISYALSHVIRQVLATTKPGDSIELGLLVGPSEQKSSPPPPSENDPSPPPADIATDEMLTCTIRISHKYHPATSYNTNTTDGNDSSSVPATRPLPSFSTMLLRHLLRQVGATLTSDLPPPKSFPEGRTCDFTLSLDPGSLSVLNTPTILMNSGENDGSGASTATEPTVDQLTLFAEGLKGKRVTLYANAKGSFAQHLTSYLTAWGMDVTHVSPDGEVDGLVSAPSSPSTVPDQPSSPLTSKPSPENMKDHHPSFIFIDDDVEVLKERLQALRAERPYYYSRQRPPLATHHRPRSFQQVSAASRMAAAQSQGQQSSMSGGVVVVHFTSISNYKMIKDVIHSVTASHANSGLTAAAAPLPEVMIIPKPAGPRRFLTALYTAVTKPVVDPFFSPIATSPSSPSVLPRGSFYHSYHNVPTLGSAGGSRGESPKMSPKPLYYSYNRPHGSRSNSDRSTKSGSPKDVLTTASAITSGAAEYNSGISTPQQQQYHHQQSQGYMSLPLGHPPAPTSPLAIPDNVEYFSEAAAKLGASPSSGLVIQSPDGQPAGIFFHPRGGKSSSISSSSTAAGSGSGSGFANTGRIPSAYTHSMERDRGQFNVLEQQIKRRNSRISASTTSPTAAVARAKSPPNRNMDNISSSTAGEPAEKMTGPAAAAARKLADGNIDDKTPPVAIPVAPTSSSSSSSVSPPQRRRSIAIDAPQRPTPPIGSPPKSENHISAIVGPGATPRRAIPRRLTQSQEASSSSAAAGTAAVPVASAAAAASGATSSSSPSASSVLAAASRKAKAVADGTIVPPISVLIVDDNPINQTILSTFMKKKKIKFDLAKNGQEAVQKWRTGGFHLILMDIQMPVMDGIQATKEIRRLEQLNAAAGYPPPGGASPFDENGSSSARTPSDVSTSDQKSTSTSTSSPYRSSVIIVALTASSLQSDRVAALAAGCNDFLTKPVSLVWLNSKIIEWGSIKALQMWADLRPEAALTMSTAEQARSVAERLRVPKGRTTPSPSRESAAGAGATSPHARSPSSANGPLVSPTSAPGTNSDQATTSSPRRSERPPPTSFWGHLAGTSAAPSAKTLSESAKDLARGGRRSFSTPQASLAGIASSIQTLDDSTTRDPQEKTNLSPVGHDGDNKHENVPSRPNSDDDDDDDDDNRFQ